MSCLLEVKDLSKHYGGLKAVNGLSLSVNEKEIVGLIGPNGAGKTTAVGLISGMTPRSGGQVIFNGQDVSDLSASQRAHRGLVRTFQHTAVYYAETVRENAQRATFISRYSGVLRSLLPCAASRLRVQQANARADELLELFGLLGHADTLARDLPYGHQKILGIVLALAVQPRLILLDEPVAGLSAEETDTVRDVIKRVRASGVGVVVIEHNMRFIAGLCDRVVVMAHGMPLAHGLPEEVLRDQRVIEAYLGRSREDAQSS